MGTRINVLLDHDLPDHRDRGAVLERLSHALPEALAVQAYWVSVEEVPWLIEARHRQTEWTADPELSMFSYHSYTGPGSLFVRVNRRTARIYTGGRWRGFLSIAGLHAVHLRAFRAVASSLGATTAVYYPDNDDLLEMFWDDRPLVECIKYLESAVGPPQPSVDAVSAEVIAEADHHVPDVWYISSPAAV